MSIIIKDIEQGSEEWMKLRMGIPTASNFDKIVTTKGAYSKQAEKYMFKLAAERVSTYREETYKNHHMERGNELEKEARDMFMLMNDVEVDICTLVYKDENKSVACSPDGLIGDDSGLEIKCPTAAVHVSYLIDNKLPTDYFQQVQGSMYVTGRKSWYFMSYYPGIRPLILKVDRDELFIAELNAAINKFNAELDMITERIK